MTDWQRRTAAALRDQLTLMGQRQLPSNRDGFDEEFDSLRALDQRVRSNHDEFYTASLGSNMSKNRYREILPNEGTRVQLDPINNRGDGDYINANYVDGRRLFGVPFVYIATQAPLRCSIGDFWRMVFENNVTFIVMLCAEIENGKVKSERYWPDGIGGVMTVGPLTLTLTAENHRHDTIYRTIQLRTADGRERELFHLQYVRWPDQGIPQTSAPLMEIIRTLGASNASARTPIVVHCSGGVGRTGVFITLHVALALFQTEQPISIPKIVQYLKFCRSGMVQRKDQYLFTYFAVLRELEKMIWSIESARQAHGLSGPMPTKAPPIMDGPDEMEEGAASPIRRPPQHVPQHPVQSGLGRSQTDVSHFNNDNGSYRPSQRQQGLPSSSSDAFGPTYASAAFDRSSSASSHVMMPPLTSHGGTVNEVEAALRSLQQKTQSYRQTPSQQRSSHALRGGGGGGGGGPREAASTVDGMQKFPRPLYEQAAAAPPPPRMASVIGRLPLETRDDRIDFTSTARGAETPPVRLPSPIYTQGERDAATRQPSSSGGIEVRNIRREAEEPEARGVAANGGGGSRENYFFSPSPRPQEPPQTTSDLEAASKNFNASILANVKPAPIGKSDVSLL